MLFYLIDLSLDMCYNAVILANLMRFATGKFLYCRISVQLENKLVHEYK